MPEITLTSVLFIVNLLTSAANVIIAFSLFVYIAARNPYHPVARGFGALMLFVSIVYGGDVMLSRVRDTQSALLWLRFQWIGIALVPAAYLHFSDALLRTTRSYSRLRRAASVAGYVIGVAFLVLAINTDLIVRGDIYFPFAPQFAAGAYFWVFGLYFFVTFAWGLLNTLWARYRCLTPTSRRRMTYLLLSFAAPALGVFPYLLLAGTSQFVTADGVLILSLIGNTGVGSMMALMAYSVSYYGAIEPDRVVKRNLIKYLIQGPLMGTAAIGLILFVPRVEALFGLPQDSLVIFAAIISIVLFQVIISLAKPILDVVSDWEDRREVAWLQRLDERLLTHSDQAQLFENILASLCDLLRAREGFVLALEGGQLKLESFVGARALVLASIHDDDIRQVLDARARDFDARHGVWLRPLFNRSGERVLGVLGIVSAQPLEKLDSGAREAIARPTEQAERSLEDRQLQSVIFGALQELRPEIESLQRYRSLTPYPGSTATTGESDSKATAAEFPQWVREALRDFWGGPKFSESPLLDLLVVHEALAQHEQSPTQALRSVLLEAIELLRPAGEPDLHAREWVLYNILHMKFIEGRRIREIADRLAMSESDLYRKQRLAIDEVARALAVMEQKVSTNGNGTNGTDGAHPAASAPPEAVKHDRPPA